MSEFYIYSADRERLGILQHYDSVQWLENYQSNGEVKIVARATRDNLEMLIDGNRIYNIDSDTVASICHVDIVETETEDTITARADITSELLSDRVVMATEAITNIEAGMYSIYQKNRRDLPIGISTAEGYSVQTDMQISWDSVLEAEKKLADISGLGFKVIFNPETGAESFKVYRGVDRSHEDSPGYIGYFGTDVGNIKNITITSGTTDYKNVAIVAGEGTSEGRRVRTVSLAPVSGEQRRELFVDARHIQSEVQIATPTGSYDDKGNPIYGYTTKTYTEAEYNAMLDAWGYKKLAEYLQTFSITCDITQINIEFGSDYFIGDRMPIKLTSYGIYASAVISAVTIIYEKEGRRIVALLNNFQLEVGQ